jgi:hypothetical protein
MIEGTKAPQPRWRWLVWLFAAVGLAAAIAIIWLAVVINASLNYRQPAIVAAQAQGETYEIGDVSRLKGTDYVAIEINRPRESGGSGSLKSGSNDQRNVLLINQKTGASHRLLPDNKTRIIAVKYAPAAATSGDDYASAYDNTPAPPPAYYALQLSREAAEGNSIALLVGQLAGFRQAIVMEGLSGIDQMWMIDDHLLGLIVREKQQMFFKVVDIPAQKVVQSRRIEIG